MTCERRSLASNPTTDRPSATSTPPRPSSAERYLCAEPGGRSGRHRSIHEPRHERPLECEVFGVAVEDFGRRVPVRHECRSGNRPPRADGGVVEVDVAVRHAPARPERGRAAEGAEPVAVPVLPRVVAVADRVRQLAARLVGVARLEDEHALARLCQRERQREACRPRSDDEAIVGGRVEPIREEHAGRIVRARDQPRPPNGIFVAITVRHGTLASSGRPAM